MNAPASSVLTEPRRTRTVYLNGTLWDTWTYPGGDLLLAAWQGRAVTDSNRFNCWLWHR